jgi:hypothetical protein
MTEKDEVNEVLRRSRVDEPDDIEKIVRRLIIDRKIPGDDAYLAILCSVEQGHHYEIYTGNRRLDGQVVSSEKD